MKRLIPLIFISHITFASAAETPKIQSCLSTREFITTLEYLRDHKDFAINETDARNLATRVSSGCTGASKRFIQVTNVLTKAGLPSKKSIETALKYAASTDELTGAFLVIFKGAYIESLLDLDVSQALNIALELSDSAKGSTKLLEKNFNELVNFCVDKKSLDLPLVECAKMGARVVKSGNEFEFNVTKDFISLFNYLTDSKINLPTYEAISVTEHVMKFGPEAKKNFIQAYEYAISKNGLDKSIKDAIEFAKSMASNSKKEI